MTEHQDEDLTRLYQQMPKSEPSSSVDEQIKMAARRQVKKARRISRFNWLATAAVLVLGISLLLRIFEQLPPDEVVRLDDLATEAKTGSVTSERSLQPGPEKATVAGQLQEGSGSPQADSAVVERFEMRKAETQARQKQNTTASASAVNKQRSATTKILPAQAGGQAVELRENEKKRLWQEKAPATKLRPQVTTAGGISSAVSLPSEQHDEQDSTVSPLSDWCGQHDLEQIDDQTQWQQRISQLQEAGDMAAVQCLMKLYQQRFFPASKPAQ